MATTTQRTPAVEALASSHRALGWAFAWGAFMLLIIGLWVNVKYRSGLALSVFLALAAAAMVQSLWMLRRPREETEPQLLGQRRFTALSLYVWGLVLTLAVVGLAVWQGLDAFPEAAGLALMALAAFGTGRALQRPVGAAKEDKYLDTLIQNRGGVGLVLMLLAAFFLVLAGWLIFTNKATHVERISALAFAIAFGGSGLWLRYAGPENVDRLNMRLLILYAGGATGLTLAVAAVLRGWLWSGEYIFGGMSDWQKEGAWRIWLCGYLEIIGLTLVFGSLLAARAEVRANAWMRRLLYGYNAGLNGLLMLAILVLLNIVVYAAYPGSFEWSKTRGAYTLAPATKNLLAGLTEPTSFYVLMRQGEEIYADVRNLMDNAQSESSQVKVRYVSPDLDDETYRKLQERFPEVGGEVRARRFAESENGVLIVYGKDPEEVDRLDPKVAAKVPHTFVSEKKIVEMTGDRFHQKGGPVTRVFKGEEEIMKELKFLSDHKTKRKIYFLQGHDELDINVAFPVPRVSFTMSMNALGAGSLVQKLKDDNYEVAGLSFGLKISDKTAPNMVYAKETGADKKKDVPDDAWAIIIAGPAKELEKETLDALDRYMKKTGKLIVLLDVISEGESRTVKATGLEDFLLAYGVQASMDYVLRYPTSPRDNVRAARIFPSPENRTGLGKQLEGVAIVMGTVRVTSPIPGAKGGFRAESLFVVPPGALPLAEPDTSVLSDPFRYLVELEKRGVLEKRVRDEPVSVGVTVTEGEEKPRMVVIGDADFITNDSLTRSPVREYLYGIVSSSLRWLSERPVLGIPPKQTNTYKLDPGTDSRIWLMPTAMMAVAILGLGIGVWVVRRR